ncbi:integrase, putative [Pseudomonas orientalis]|nr:integrase, putative [Pseudomonas orientalis]
MLVAHTAPWLTAPLKAKTAKIEAPLLNEERTFEYVAKQWLAFKSADQPTSQEA